MNCNGDTLGRDLVAHESRIQWFNTSQACGYGRLPNPCGAIVRTPIGPRTTLSLRAFALSLAFALAGCGGSLDTTPSISQAPPQKQLDQPVQHVFVILKENHPTQTSRLRRRRGSEREGD